MCTVDACYYRNAETTKTVHELKNEEEYFGILTHSICQIIPDVTEFDKYKARLFMTTALAVDGFDYHPIFDRVNFFWYLQGKWNGYVGAEYPDAQYERGFLGVQALLHKYKSYPPMANASRNLWREYPCK